MMRFTIFLLFASTTLSLRAHPGHDLTEHGLGHAVTSSFHLLMIVLVSALCFTFRKLVVNHRVKSVLSSTGAVALLVAAVLWCLRH
jgi:hypothetical protein